VEEVHLMKSNIKLNDDQHTETTESIVSHECGIPTVIYFRTDGPPVVPDDEPLAEIFNIPDNMLPKLKKNRLGLRTTFVRSIRRLTGFGRRSGTIKMRLSSDDPEVRMQTLVDL
jgi:hypothetical protein